MHRALGALGVTLLAVIVACLLAFVSAFLLLMFTNAGENTVVVEGGRRVAHFGLPLRYATVDVDEDLSRGRPYRVGDEAYFNPWETPATVDGTKAWFDYGFVLRLSGSAHSHRSSSKTCSSPSSSPSPVWLSLCAFAWVAEFRARRRR